MLENMRLRRELPADYRDVEAVTRMAFWNHYVPGCNEHYLAHIMRDSSAFVRELDYVAEFDGTIAGSIMYTEARIVCDDGSQRLVLSFGPVSVLPKLQGKGIGSLLIGHTLKLATELGYDAVLIYGDPHYYSRFGFRPAEVYGIGTSDDMYADALLAVELREGALSGCAGRFFEDCIYDVNEADAAEFDSGFPHLDKLEGVGAQRRFQELAAKRVQRK